MKRLILALAMVVMVSPAWGVNFKNGNALYKECTADKSSDTYFQQQVFCAAYIAGIIDATDGVDRGVGSFKFCMPLEADLRQARDVVVAWLKVHPENRHFGASDLVAAALQEAWPCP